MQDGETGAPLFVDESTQSAVTTHDIDIQVTLDPVARLQKSRVQDSKGTVFVLARRFELRGNTVLAHTLVPAELLAAESGPMVIDPTVIVLSPVALDFKHNGTALVRDSTGQFHVVYRVMNRLLYARDNGITFTNMGAVVQENPCLQSLREPRHVIDGNDTLYLGFNATVNPATCSTRRAYYLESSTTGTVTLVYGDGSAGSDTSLPPFPGMVVEDGVYTTFGKMNCGRVNDASASLMLSSMVVDGNNRVHFGLHVRGGIGSDLCKQRLRGSACLQCRPRHVVMDTTGLHGICDGSLCPTPL